MRIFEGIVTSIGMQRTVSVHIERKVPHPLYRKVMKKSKNFLVDSGDLEIKVGDKVKIAETKPMSKNKFFKVSEILGRKSLPNSKKPPEAKNTDKAVPKEKPVKKIVRKKRGAK